jgi:hypothetical protein
MSARAFGAVATLMLFNTAVSAQTSAADNVIQSFQRCRSITTVEARLECFDKAASVLGNAVKNKEITIVDRQEVRQARRSLFGFTIPRLSLFGGDDRDETRGCGMVHHRPHAFPAQTGREDQGQTRSTRQLLPGDRG